MGMRKLFKGFVVFILVFVAFSMAFVGSVLYKEDLERGVFRDIYRFTEGLSVNYSCSSVSNDSFGVAGLKVERLNRVTCAFSDFIVVSGTEAVKFGVEFGYENPEYDYGYFAGLVKLGLFYLVFVASVPVIVPVIALFYLLVVGGVWLVKWVLKKLRGSS